MEKELINNLWEEITKAKNITLVGHRKPDGDALGSMCAMKMWLASLGKEVRMACIDKPSARYKFLPCMDKIENDLHLEDCDLLIVLDCGAHYMTDFHQKYPEIIASNQGEDVVLPIVNIDHHASNDNFGHLNLVDMSAASVTMILYNIFTYLDVEIGPEMATCLLTGLYNDTGSFMHSNTSRDVYMIAADLLAQGAQISPISRNLFKSNSVSTLKLWGKALMNAEVTDENFVVSVVRESELIEGEDPDQLGGVIDYLNMVPDVDFAMLIKEDRGHIKGSFRTRKDDVDLSKMAALYGGGGHPKASGFSIPGHLAD
ncbi:bifunctional oligoribonuclease/PAP phosphatase NrnA [Candidatus Peregrinibacteria bacterium]|jgi:bifunctional oligoribonuclease and PAP phosphatase NrnA|nr:bifunctional oligoribonuclease/PAP phosphatase NrnA [Candidatus Peregrinibacteria bacterium]MBT4056417.1 bifunctional oligoribonuclease/PAP phosphatase NrnA [Candidatus Peregrinibacteria bacterium]